MDIITEQALLMDLQKRAMDFDRINQRLKDFSSWSVEERELCVALFFRQKLGVGRDPSASVDEPLVPKKDIRSIHRAQFTIEVNADVQGCLDSPIYPSDIGVELERNGYRFDEDDIYRLGDISLCKEWMKILRIVYDRWTPTSDPSVTRHISSIGELGLYDVEVHLPGHDILVFRLWVVPRGGGADLTGV